MEKKNLKGLENWKAVDKPGDYWPVDFQSAQLQTATFCVEVGGRVHKHKHKREDNFWYVVSGRGRLVIGGESIPVEEGDAVLIPRDTFHEAHADAGERLRILQVECISGPEKGMSGSEEAGLIFG